MNGSESYSWFSSLSSVPFTLTIHTHMFSLFNLYRTVRGSFCSLGCTSRSLCCAATFSSVRFKYLSFYYYGRIPHGTRTPTHTHTPVFMHYIYCIDTVFIHCVTRLYLVHVFAYIYFHIFAIYQHTVCWAHKISHFKLKMYTYKSNTSDNTRTLKLPLFVFVYFDCCSSQVFSWCILLLLYSLLLAP